MARPDLVALSDDSLAALANRGIVKRAVRDVAEGAGPTVTEGDAATVTGTFADGTVAVLPVGVTVDQATCTCPATGVCRHVVMAVVAYRAAAASDASAPAAAEAGLEAWSPGEFDDAALEATIGSRALAQARRARRAGYRARVVPASAADPVPTVELATCTVRFLAPHELGYARVDAARGTRADAIALAVWAWQAHDAGGGSEASELAVGGDEVDRAPSGSGLEPLLGLLADLVADGAAHLGAAIDPALAQARRALEARNLRWPVDALDEVADQLGAYRSRSARYQSEDLAAALVELVARHRCTVGGGAPLRPSVLGTEESAETRLRLVRLVGLGAQVRVVGDARATEVYLGHREAGLVLAVRRTVEAPADLEHIPAGAVLGRHKVTGVRLADLAGGDVVTESAVRSASRVVRIAASGLAKTTVAPSRGAWADLPPSILAADLDRAAAQLAGRAARVVRPRVVAESLRVVPISEVLDVTYEPGAQRLVARVAAPIGRARVVLAHTSATPGAVDALARALSGTDGPPRFLAGHLGRHGGELVLTPTAVALDDRVVVPAFAAATGELLARRPSADAGAALDPLAGAVAEALAVSAEVSHRGVRDLSTAWRSRAEAAGARLARVGLNGAAASVQDVARLAPTMAPEVALSRWADAHLRLLVTAEQL